MSLLSPGKITPRDVTRVSSILSNLTAPANSETADVSEYGSATIQVIGSSLSGVNVVIEGRRATGYPWAQLSVEDLSTGVHAMQITSVGMYRASTRGVRELRARLIAISGGTLSAYLGLDRSPPDRAPVPLSYVSTSGVNAYATGESVGGRRGPHVHVANRVMPHLGGEGLPLIRSGEIPPNGRGNLVDRAEPMVIDHLEWSCNSALYVRIRIAQYLSGESPVPINMTPSISGASMLNSWTPGNILSGRSAFWEILEYNEASNLYKFALARPLTFHRGASIRIENIHDSTAYMGAVFGLVRMMAL